MANPKKSTFGDLERSVMNAVWDRSDMSVRDVWTAIRPHHHVAYTTVMTVMNRLVDRGCLKRRMQTTGAYTYAAVATRDHFGSVATKTMVQSLVRQYGDAALVQFLEAIDRVPEKKLDALRRHIRKSRP